ncbi:hypothetical protein ACSBR1_006887 [Camellia fascicularis]
MVRNTRPFEQLPLWFNSFNMSSLTSLSHLNLSYNNLSGSIPSTNQFQTFNDPSIYEGNPELSTTDVDAKDKDGKKKVDNKEDEYDELWFYLSTGVGFIKTFQKEYRNDLKYEIL